MYASQVLVTNPRFRSLPLCHSVKLIATSQVLVTSFPPVSTSTPVPGLTLIVLKMTLDFEDCS